jgi:hypothetical protein
MYSCKPAFAICGRPPSRKLFCSFLIRSLALICPACLRVRTLNVGQDGFRDESSRQIRDLIEGHRRMRYFSHQGSIDHTVYSSCKFWHRLSTVAVELLPVSG